MTKSLFGSEMNGYILGFVRRGKEINIGI